MHMAVVAAFDLDVRKNFEASIAQRFATSGPQVTTPIGGQKDSKGNPLNILLIQV